MTKNIVEEYQGEWTDVQAAHLLRRTTFGISRERIQEIIDLGMDDAVDHLLREVPLPEAPVNLYNSADEFAAIGEPWFDKAFSTDNKRKLSFFAWMVDGMVNEGNHIREKLTLFWHNHFVVSNHLDARFLFQYSQTLRQHALGDFGDFVKAITIDPGMLRYLNGRENNASSPNENYARELLELFTVGKGELAGEGDYTTFTETDVRSIARVLTGWRDLGHRSRDQAIIGSEFRESRHDKETKIMSHRFGNITIENEGAEEYKSLIDILLDSEHTATHICRKLYRFFIHYTIDEGLEESLISSLANVFRQNQFQIRPLLKVLFTSQAFYDDCAFGSMIRNPLDFIINTVVTFPTKLGRNGKEVFDSYVGFIELSNLLQMELYNHPDVAGWKAYYQAPGFYQIWINSVTLPIRGRITDELLQGDDQLITGVNILNFIDSLPNPYDLDILIQDIAYLIYPKPLKEEQIDALKDVVIPGLPDFEWTVEYTSYRINLEDFPLLWSVRIKMKNLLITMLRLPEYYLS